MIRMNLRAFLVLLSAPAVVLFLHVRHRDAAERLQRADRIGQAYARFVAGGGGRG